MTIPFSKVAEQISDVLMSSNYDVQWYDDYGIRVYEKEAARKFFTTPGNHIISIHDEGDGIAHIKVSLSEPVDIEEYQNTIGNKLRNIAARTGDNMSYDVRTFGKTLTPRDFAHETKRKDDPMTEVRVNEGLRKMTGTSRTSYQQVGECKLIVRHFGRVNEEKHGARSRNINAIFVETRNGERFKMAENSLHGARALARHLSNGGNPFDTVGKKITEMVQEMAQMRDMVKEARSIRKNAPLSEEAGVLVEQIRNRYVNMRETLQKMTGKVGYFTHTADLHEEEQLEEINKDLINRDSDEGRKILQRIDPEGEKAKEVGKRIKMKRDAERANVPSYVKDPVLYKRAKNKTEDIIDEFDGSIVHEDDWDSPDDWGTADSGEEKFKVDPATFTEHVQRLGNTIEAVIFIASEMASPIPSGLSQLDQLKDEVTNNWSDEERNALGKIEQALEMDTEIGVTTNKALMKAIDSINNAGFGPFDQSLANHFEVLPDDQIDDEFPDFHSSWFKTDDKGEYLLDPEDVEYDDEGKTIMKQRKDAEGNYVRKPRPEPVTDSIHEAEEEGSISTEKQTHTYVSNTSEFDRPVGGKKAHDTNYVLTDLDRDNSENMHSINVEESELPENVVIESWFDDMVRVEFFNEQDENVDEQDELDEKCGKKHKKMKEDDKDTIEEAADKLNMHFGTDEFDNIVKEYHDKGILPEITETLEEDSSIWNALNEFAVTYGDADPLDEPNEPIYEDPEVIAAFKELETMVGERNRGLEEAIHEISQGYDNSVYVASKLHELADQSGLAKHDMGSDFADKLLSHNDEIANDKEENEFQEFGGVAGFVESKESSRILELAGLTKKKSRLDEETEIITESLDCGCGEGCKCAGSCNGKCGDENCPCECGERTGKGLNECGLSNVVSEEIEPDDLTEQFTDQNLARIIQLAKFKNNL